MPSKPIPVITFDLLTARSRALAQNDAVNIRGKYNNNITVTAGALINFSVTPRTGYSDRLVNLNSYYQKYRIKELIVKVQFPSGTSTNNQLVLGIDEDLAIVTPPTTANAVSAFRCSTTISGPDSDPSDVLLYRPSDKKRWYYTNTDAIDDRFAIQATMFVANPTGTSVQALIEVYFNYSFCQSAGNGAFDLSDPFNRPLSIQHFPRTTNESDDTIVVQTPRHTPLSAVPPKRGFF